MCHFSHCKNNTNCNYVRKTVIYQPYIFKLYTWFGDQIHMKMQTEIYCCIKSKTYFCNQIFEHFSFSLIIILFFLLNSKHWDNRCWNWHFLFKYLFIYLCIWETALESENQKTPMHSQMATISRTVLGHSSSLEFCLGFLCGQQGTKNSGLPLQCPI